MLQRSHRTGDRAELPRGAIRALWALAALDVMAVSWMLAAGDWLDRAAPVTSVITLGGHHRVVLVLGVAGFLLLAGVATTTGGFLRANRVEQITLAVAGLLSTVALAGIISVAGMIVGAALLVALIGRALR